MLTRNLFAILLGFGLLGITIEAVAQEEEAPPKKSILNRVDDFGKSVFGGIFPVDKKKAKDSTASKSENRPSSTNPPTTDPFGEVKSPRAGSILSGAKTNSQSVSIEKTARGQTDPTLEPALPRIPREEDGTTNTGNGIQDFSRISRSADGTPKQVRRSLADKSLLVDEDIPAKTQQNTPVASPRKESKAPSGYFAEVPDLSAKSKPEASSLHERLSNFRQSVFEPEEQLDSIPLTKAQPEQKSNALAAQEPKDSAPKAINSAEHPRLSQRIRPATRSEDAVPAEPTLNSPTATPPTRSGIAVPAEPTLNRPTATPPASSEKFVYIESGGNRTTKPAMSETMPSAAEDKPASPNSVKDDGVLMARKGPSISTETVGPRKITVGKESTYEVTILNSSETSAEDLLVFVSLPTWAEVAGIETSTGVASASPAGQNSGAIQWKVGRLNTKVRERLTLRIVPRQNRPFDLAVRWEYKPSASQAMIEVQEPKLLLQLEGAREVLFGKKEVYRLKLANTGNGDAENVAISLVSIGTGENVPASHKVGVLAAGEEKVLDVELTARQPGNLTIQVEANADGGAHAELAEKVLVRRAALKIDIEGPKLQFVGASTAYVVHLSNTGNAPARNVNLSLSMPAGTKYLSGIENARLSESGDTLDWTVDSVGPEVEQRFVVKCSLGTAGMSRLKLNATADDDLTASSEAAVRVDAVANLIMDLKNPEGPVPIGEEAIYEVRVRNRGSKEAEGVEVFAFFSRGIEPTVAEGAPNRLGPGQVTFSPIASLAPGAEAVFKVRAKAEVAGNLVFRAEAHCKPLNARLISEATNLFYTDSPVEKQAELTPISPQMK